MFEMLRKMIFPIIIIVLVVFMGMIVLQWGLGMSGGRDQARATAAGVVNGEEISWQAWQNNYNSLYQTEAQKTNGEVSDSRSKELEQQAFNQLVADHILLQEAQKRHIVVTPDDVYMYLKVSPPKAFQMSQQFQTDGKFDYQKYLAAMADPQYASVWNAIEPDIRRDLTKIRVQQMVTSAPHVTDAEVRRAYIDAKESVKVGAVNAQTTTYYAQVPNTTDEEATKYFDENHDKYKVGERVNIRFVALDMNPSAADSAAALKLANDLYDSVTTGSDFAELAQIYSDDPGSGQNGGELGTFAKGRMVPPFDSAVFAMKEGEISKPVETRFGWHIIKNEGFQKDKDGKEEVKASHILIKPKASNETLQERLDKLEQFSDRAKAVGFDSAATEYELPVDTVTEVLQGQRIKGLEPTPIPEVTDWAFAAKPGDVSGVFRTRNHYAVVAVDDHLPAGPATYAQVVDQVKRDVRQDKALALAKQTIDKVWEAVKGGASLQKAAKGTDAKYADIGPFTRMSNVQALNSDPIAIGTAFSLDSIGQITPPVEYSNGYVIMKLLERTSPAQTDFENERDSVKQALMTSEQQNAYVAWYGEKLAAADVQNNLNWQNEAR